MIIIKLLAIGIAVGVGLGYLAYKVAKLTYDELVAYFDKPNKEEK